MLFPKCQELIGVVGILVVGIGTIISAINGTIEPSKVGLAISYTIMVSLKVASEELPNLLMNRFWMLSVNTSLLHSSYGQ